MFGYRPGNVLFQAGEFGHNDFYPVVIAAAHVLYGTPRALDGRSADISNVALDISGY